MFAAVLLLGALPAADAQAPLALHPDNPHYFLFRGKPAVLVTSGEHYGAVLNLDFDYHKYLRTLEADGLNLTRTFTGAYVEPSGAFHIAENTLAPAKGRFLAPWSRSETPGNALGGNKFDLRRFDDGYFHRLKDFVAEAGQRGVVVEINLFCPFYEETQWRLSPFHPGNNVNGLGNVARTDVYTLDKAGGLLDVQKALIEKVVTELKDCDNIYYEICNEPYFGGVTLAWQHQVADVIVATEKDFPAKHLISQNVANGAAKVEKPHPAVSIFNFHYASPPDTVALNYALNNVVGDNETGFRGTEDAAYRMEGWDFVLAGGGLFNNLDYSFTVGREDGTFAFPASQPGGGGKELRKQLRVLKEFIDGFAFVQMKPDSTTLAGEAPAGFSVRGLSEAGRAYAFYLRPKPAKKGAEVPKRAKEVALQLALSPGLYKAEWIDPLSGKVVKDETFSHDGKERQVVAPPCGDEVALRIRRTAEK
jgi:hypothetical protein